jgi:hypothetical protein
MSGPWVKEVLAKNKDAPAQDVLAAAFADAGEPLSSVVSDYFAANNAQPRDFGYPDLQAKFTKVGLGRHMNLFADIKENGGTIAWKDIVQKLIAQARKETRREICDCSDTEVLGYAKIIIA